MLYQNCKDFSLGTDGVQVVEGVLNEHELVKLREKMWHWLHFKTQHTSKPVVKNDQTTYKSLFELFPKHGMLFQHWDFGHNPLSWYLRQHPKVIAEFKEIWKTDELLTSFDGISVSLPCEATGRGWTRHKEWFHTDQCYKRNGFECAQGLINLFDVREGDGTLRVLRGSQALHAEAQECFKIKSSSDWCLLTPEQKQFYVDRLDEDADMCVKAPAGSLVLWDSRTIHQGMEPQRSRERPNIRCVPYVCMTPAALATKKQLMKRVEYFEKRRTCNHWPHKIKVFPVTPRTYNKDIMPPRVDKDTLEVTELMKKLVGYDYL